MIRRHSMSHAILAALSVQPMDQRQLRRHGRLFGSAHAVVVTVHRLAERGLIDTRVRLTQRGRRVLEGQRK